MKKFLTLLLLLATASLPASAAKKISKTLKKAHEATCSVMAYDADGTLIGTGQGFFVGERGELLAPYTLFLGARSAVATDAAGATRQVLKVKGANELYNVIRLSVETDKKQRTLAVDSVVLAVGQRLYLPPVSTAKKEAGDWLTVCKVQGISDGHSYYTLVGPSTPAQLAGRPLLTEEGQLAAVLQPSTEGDTLFYVLDARFGAGLDIKALTLNEPSYRNLVFPKSLPEDVEQAQVYLFVASNQNETTYYAEIVESFISQFPDNADGYIRRAALLVAEGDTSRFVQAEADQAKALELAENKDDIHYQISRQIIGAVQADTAFHYSDWTLNRAAAETEKAIEINPLSVYWQQLGDIRYALDDGKGALDAYLAIFGILNADTMLNYHDFRAYEHAFMMMSQVSGRAGRKGRRGLVILQTKSPDLPVIRQIVDNDYNAFFRSIMAERRQFRYPPFTRLVYVYLKHRSDSLVDTAGLELGSRLRQWFGARVLGPDRPAVAKVKSLAIRKLLLKIEPGLDLPTVRRYLTLAQQQMLQDKRYASLQIYFDVDPL